jgi:Ca2+-transporting ATPase
MMNDRGLSAAEASRRLAADGPNEIPLAKRATWWTAIAAQLSSFIVWLLVAAAAVSLVIREVADALAILTVVVLNAVIGSIQELRAERMIEALRSLTEPLARVVRDGQSLRIPTREVVVGDTLLLEAGEVAAADARLVSATALRANEAIITGESEPVLKHTGDRVIMGSSVMTGTGSAEVERIGRHTVLGDIAKLASQARDDETPLRTRVNRLSKVLVGASVAIVVLIAIVAMVRGAALAEVFLTSVSLAVAAVPEGLPAVVTIALAVGVRRMARRNVLVRKLEAVETLGCTTVICSDKTGTLTTGTMAVRELWGNDTGALLDAACACCDPELDASGRAASGDPTELAIVASALERGIRLTDIDAARPRVRVRPFDEATRSMAIVRADGRVYVKGALEVVMAQCSSGADGVVEAAQTMSRRGLRVLAVATGDGATEQNLRCLGLIGIADPPRAEAMNAVRAAQRAGISTVMLTGDHMLTAYAIATEIGIVSGDGGDTQLVRARVTPADKLAIVRELKQSGQIVAMTGDGVNDAPALREAHVGIAMGKAGSAVAREAADVVLADDNFASIVEGVREGRSIFEGIRRSIIYLLSGNAAELGLMLVCVLAGWPLPLLPLQLLWINLVTDALPALALVVQPTRGNVMAHRPRSPDEKLVGRPEWITVCSGAVLQTAATAGFFAWLLARTDLATARSATFSLVIVCELGRALVAQAPATLGALWTRSPLVIAVVLGSLVLQGALQMLPVTQHLFELRPLPLGIALTAPGLAVVVTLVLSLTLVTRQWASHRRGSH